MTPLRVGSLVIATRTTGVCEIGERGVCYEVYSLDSGDGPRPGYSFIFELGRYDGFSPDEVALMLQPLDVVCEAVAEYRFTNVMRLWRDYEDGVFDAALPVARIARRCREFGRAFDYGCTCTASARGYTRDVACPTHGNPLARP